MDKRIPTSIFTYKEELENLAGKEILIVDYQGTAYFDSNQTIYVSLESTNTLEEKLFHELTHVYFRYNDYPSFSVLSSITGTDRDIIQKLVSFPEELLVDSYLGTRGFPFDDTFYESVFYQVITSVDVANPLNKLETALHDLRYIRLLVDKRHNGQNVQTLKERYISINGITKWNFISAISSKIKTSYVSNISDKEKLKNMFLVMIESYKLTDKVIINEKT